MSLSFQPIKPLLQTGANKNSRWFSYIGLGIGVLLLLCSIQMFINIQQLLKEGSIKKEGFDFISISKNITNETMGQPEKNLFSNAEIEDLKKQPFITEVSPLISNEFRVKFSAGEVLPFSTDMFIESVDNSFIDTLPPSFTWQEGQPIVPVILSSDFFEIYNVFAPGQGLPQMSKETAMGIPVQIICYNHLNQEVKYIGKIAAFSDRIKSVLVPKNFLTWANQQYGNKPSVSSGRIYLKLKNVNNTAFIQYLKQHDYKIRKDATMLGENKLLLQGIFSSLGIFGLLVVVLALLLFSFYLQLVIARSRESLELLLTLGYSPKWLVKKVVKQFIPVYIIIVLVALMATQIIQYLFHQNIMYNRPELHSYVDILVIIIAIILVLLSIFTNHRLVKKLLNKMY